MVAQRDVSPGFEGVVTLTNQKKKINMTKDEAFLLPFECLSDTEMPLQMKKSLKTKNKKKREFLEVP